MVSAYSSIQAYVPFQFWHGASTCPRQAICLSSGDLLTENEQESHPRIGAVLQTALSSLRHELLCQNVHGTSIRTYT